jgi:hypothetical protein
MRSRAVPTEQNAVGTLCAVASAPATKLCPPYGSEVDHQVRAATRPLS